MFKKLRNKMLVVNMSIISIITFSSFAIIYVLTSINIYNDNLDKLSKAPIIGKEQPKDNQRVEQIENLYSFKENEEFENATVREYFAKFDTTFNILLDEEENITKISSYLELDEEEYINIIKEIMSEGETIGTIKINEEEWMYNKSVLNATLVSMGIYDNSYYEVSFLNITDTSKTLDFLLITLIILGIFMLVIIFIISKYFADKAIKPIENIWKKQTQFVADATHELKTPLTIINANVDAISINKESKVAEQSKWLEYIKKETEGMNKLVNELLISAKSEEEKYTYTNTNISNLVEELIISIETIIFEKNIKLDIDIESEIESEVDPDKLRQAILILLDNAIKYSNENGYIKIRLIKGKKFFELTIENSGKGISEEELPYIFDRFYKCDKSRTENNSYGLGLFIAKNIINKLKGKIVVDSIENDKTIFTIKI